MTFSKEDLQSFLQEFKTRFGYDFLNYTPNALERRVQNILIRNNIESLTELSKKIFSGKLEIEVFLSQFTVTTTEMFRDPPFFKVLVDNVFPILQTFPSLRIWHAGCSSGEEVYSLAILLKEAGLLARTQIFATDINPSMLNKSLTAVFSVEEIEKSNKKYKEIGGKRELSDYFVLKGKEAEVLDEFKQRVSVFGHSLVTDEVFSEVHVVLCRNVLIYFDKTMQERAIQLFNRSLCYKGFLCLGIKETINFCQAREHFEPISDKEKVYRKTSKIRYNAFSTSKS